MSPRAIEVGFPIAEINRLTIWIAHSSSSLNLNDAPFAPKWDPSRREPLMMARIQKHQTRSLPDRGIRK